MFIKGFTYGYDARRGDFRTPEADASMVRMASLGGDWTALALPVMQDTWHSTVIRPDYRFTPTERDVIAAVNRLHGLGLKVCMKPMVNCADGVWRANISFPPREIAHDGRDYWNDWFDSYTAFLCHYAEIAEETGCEMFCVGCEMCGTEGREQNWRDTVAKVRKVYSGPLVYNTNHGREDSVRWWDLMDYIGTSAYYRVADKPGESPENMVSAWNRHKARLAEISRCHGGKQIIFMEIGCRSAAGCAMMPYDFSHREFPYDESEQANFYESCFRAMWNEPWFAGFFWWDWYTKLPSRSPEMGFTVCGKQAEDVVKSWYAKEPHG